MLTLFATLSLLGAPAPAARPSEQIRWTAPSGCPDEAELKARVDRILATGGSGRREAVDLRLVVDRTTTGFRLTAALADGDTQGQRVVEAASCEDLTEAAVLIAAIAIDPDLVPPAPSEPTPDEPSTTEPSTTEPDATVPAPPSVTEPGVAEPGVAEPAESAPSVDARPIPETSPRGRGPALADEPRPARRLLATPLVAIDLGIGMGRLAAPVPMGLLRAGAGVEIGAFRGLARISAFGPSVGDVEGFDGGGRFGAITGGLAGCGRTLGSPWSFVGCLATDLGVAFGRGRGTEITRSASSLWWGLEAEAGVERAFGPRWALALRGDGGVMPVRTDFSVDEQGRACCVRWGAGLRLGVVARFGARPQR